VLRQQCTFNFGEGQDFRCGQHKGESFAFSVEDQFLPRKLLILLSCLPDEVFAGHKISLRVPVSTHTC